MERDEVMATLIAERATSVLSDFIGSFLSKKVISECRILKSQYGRIGKTSKKVKIGIKIEDRRWSA
jgi:hypothetical protein